LADGEAGEVEGGLQDAPGLGDPQRPPEAAVGVDVPPAQVMGEVMQAAVAGEQRCLVQGVGGVVGDVGSRLPGSVGDRGDLADSFRERQACGPGPPDKREVPQRGGEHAIAHRG
jgi:hypothetical protein